MWYDEAVIYQIYPLGLCGAPLQNDGDPSQADQHRLLRVLDWVDHIKALGATCVLFNPLFESDAHGYDTRDYNKVDGRLGTNDDLKQVCAALHAAGIGVVMDVVYNHMYRNENPLNDTVPCYFFRQNEDGSFSNGSGCG